MQLCTKFMKVYSTTHIGLAKINATVTPHICNNVNTEVCFGVLDHISISFCRET